MSTTISATQHRALFLQAKAGTFSIQETETPHPGPGQLLVKVEAVGLNPVDWKIQKYGVYVESYPAILGTDIAGIVQAVGAGVTRFAVGDRVLYQGVLSKEQAGFQQFSIADEELTAKVPENVSIEEAASIPVCLAAAFIGLYCPEPHGAGLSPPLESGSRGDCTGRSLVVLGGATSVGQYAIQLGRLSGFAAIITTASLKHASFLKSLGATHVIDRQLPLSSLSIYVKEQDFPPIAIVFDPVSSPETMATGQELLPASGHLITTLPPKIASPEGKTTTAVLGTFVLPHTRPLGVRMYSRLHSLLAEGLIRPNRVEVLSDGLQGVVDGLSKLASGGVSGVKLVARPQETPMQ
ncbi:chaperonin 10-like protein [Infundibulicybe gibba]|nr:chaperonin 10-like protein [Infundibulicybe gibba]